MFKSRQAAGLNSRQVRAIVHRSTLCSGNILQIRIASTSSDRIHIGNCHRFWQRPRQCDGFKPLEHSKAEIVLLHDLGWWYFMLCSSQFQSFVYYLYVQMFYVSLLNYRRKFSQTSDNMDR